MSKMTKIDEKGNKTSIVLNKFWNNVCDDTLLSFELETKLWIN